MNSHPFIDHSLLSPSGSMSKRARRAALKRDHDLLFPPGFWDKPEITESEKHAAEAAELRRSASTLRELAAKGMSRRKFLAAAARIEAEADAIEKRLQGSRDDETRTLP